MNHAQTAKKMSDGNLCLQLNIKNLLKTNPDPKLFMQKVQQWIKEYDVQYPLVPQQYTDVLSDVMENTRRIEALKNKGPIRVLMNPEDLYQMLTKRNAADIMKSHSEFLYTVEFFRAKFPKIPILKEAKEAGSPTADEAAGAGRGAAGPTAPAGVGRVTAPAAAAAGGGRVTAPAAAAAAAAAGGGGRTPPSPPPDGAASTKFIWGDRDDRSSDVAAAPTAPRSFGAPPARSFGAAPTGGAPSFGAAPTGGAPSFGAAPTGGAPSFGADAGPTGSFGYGFGAAAAAARVDEKDIPTRPSSPDSSGSAEAAAPPPEMTRDVLAAAAAAAAGARMAAAAPAAAPPATPAGGARTAAAAPAGGARTAAAAPAVGAKRPAVAAGGGSTKKTGAELKGGRPSYEAAESDGDD